MECVVSVSDIHDEDLMFLGGTECVDNLSVPMHLDDYGDIFCLDLSSHNHHNKSQMRNPIRSKNCNERHTRK